MERTTVPGLTVVKVKALVAFTKTTRHGQFHGNPQGTTDATRFPKIPDYTVDELIEAGKVEPVGSGNTDMSQLRDHYKTVTGKNPFMGWDADELNRRIAEQKGAPAPVTGSEQSEEAPI